MNRLLIIVCFFTTHFSCAQKAKWNEVIVDNKSTYDIPNEGKVVNTLFDVPETRDTVRSAMILDNDTLFTILFTKAELRGDTLKILIHQTDAAYHQEYVITVIKNRYNITYDLRTPIDPERSIMGTLETKLKLNSLEFKKGKELRGYTEYKGKCIKGCFQGESLVTVKGNFMAVIE